MPTINLGNASVFRGGVDLGPVQRVLRAGVEIWSRPAPTGLDPATSTFMILPNSKTSNRHQGRAWENGQSSQPYSWPADFRPEWTGGAGSGYLAEPFSAAIGSDTGGSYTKARWDQPDTFWSAGTDPRRDLSGVEVLVVNQGDLGQIAAPYQWTNRPVQEQLVEDETHTLLFVEQFVTQSTAAKAILIEADPPQLLNTSDSADDGPWRALIDTVELSAHYHRDRIRAWLDANGHPGIEVKVVPYHRLARRVYDDALEGNVIPGGVTTHRAFRAGWGEGGGATHRYMMNRTGMMSEALLFSYVAFERMPDTTGDYTDRDVSPALAAYFTSIVQDIADNYAPAGLGGADEGTIGATLYTGETEADLFGAAIVSKTDVPLDAKWADLARTTPAVEGGPVAAIGDFEAVSGSAVPILTGDTLTFSRQPIRHTLAGPRDRAYFVMVVDMVQTANYSTVMTSPAEMEFNRQFTMVQIRAPEGNITVVVGDMPLDGGNRALIEVTTDGSTGTARIVDLDGAGSEFLRSGSTGQSGMATVTEIIHNSTLWADPHEESLRYSLFLDRMPTDAERSLFYDLLSQKLGLQVW